MKTKKRKYIKSDKYAKERQKQKDEQSIKEVNKKLVKKWTLEAKEKLNNENIKLKIEQNHTIKIIALISISFITAITIIGIFFGSNILVGVIISCVMIVVIAVISSIDRVLNY